MVGAVADIRTAQITSGVVFVRRRAAPAIIFIIKVCEASLTLITNPCISTRTRARCEVISRYICCMTTAISRICTRQMTRRVRIESIRTNTTILGGVVSCSAPITLVALPLVTAVTHTAVDDVASNVPSVAVAIFRNTTTQEAIRVR